MLLDDLRVLDLTDRRGDLGAHLLADLGADVVAVRPAGVASDELDAYNANKELLLLPDEPAEAGHLLADLVARCDVVMDSGRPALLDRHGLDRAAVARRNPRIVHVVVTPFGVDGPRADQPATELTVAALGGPVWLQGDRDRPPLHLSVPQTWRHAGAEAAGAALLALRRRDRTGQAQFVDVSAQAVMTWTLLNAMEAHAIQGREFERDGAALNLSIPVLLRIDAADGWVVGVPTARLAGPLVPWLVEEGVVEPSWLTFEWTTFDHRHLAAEPTEVPLAEVEAAIRELCRRHTRRDLFHRALALGATLAPLNDVADLLAFEHLAARSFWTAPAGTADVRRPGAAWVVDGRRPAVRRGPMAWPHAGRGVGGAAVASRWQPRSQPPPPPHRNGPQDDPPDLPLHGLHVLDLSWVGVGPITGRALADHGATVVRVESELRPDGLRRQPPYIGDEPGINRSNFFGAFNTSKLSLALDLKNPTAIEVARRLARWADVVIESFTPGTVERLGLGYDLLSKGHPGLVMVSTSLLGPGSGLSSMAGYGYHAAAVAGYFGLVGWPDRPPVGPWLAYTDTIGPRFLVPAILAALASRERTGRGCHIEASQLEMSLQLLAPELARYQLDGTLPRANGNRRPDLAPQGVYPTRGDDRWLAISVPDDAAWEGLVEVLGRPGWAVEPALATLEGRLREHDAIDGQLAAWTADHDGGELELQLSRLGVPAGMVQTSRDLLGDPQYGHRQFYHRLDHSEVGPVTYAGHQFRIDGYASGPRFAAPCLGEHSWEVLTGILGLDPDEAAGIAATGALS